jgi:hypothetical protein
MLLSLAFPPTLASFSRPPIFMAVAGFRSRAISDPIHFIAVVHLN